ncbi:MAG: type II secretion system secretin GspD [Candidatus Dadabacteria bacterium]
MIKGLLINIVILGFLLTLYVYVNTNHEKPVVMENSAETSELPPGEATGNPLAEEITYTIKEGDTLSTLGEKFGVSVAEIKQHNGLTRDTLSKGDIIGIPPKGSYTVAGSFPDGFSDGSVIMTQAASTEEIIGREIAQQFDTTELEQRRKERQEEIEKRRQGIQQQRSNGGGRKEFQQPSQQQQIQRPQQQTQQQQQEPQNGNGQQAETQPQEPEVVITDGEIVNLQSEMDIQDLIQTISEITGQSFVLDETVKGKKITVIAPGGFKRENAMRLFETILSLNGFSVVKKDGINIIVPKRDIKITSIPTEVGTSYGVSSDSFTTRLVQLKNTKADEVAAILKPLVSREGDVVVYPALNMLIIIETTDNLNRILSIIENLDVETEIEFVKIHNTDAAEVAAKLVEIFGGTASSTSSRPQGQQPAAQTRGQSRTAQRSRNLPGSDQPGDTSNIIAQSTGESSPVGFKVITDERTNSLIVIAYPDDMAKIKAVIEILDVETDQPEEGIYVVRVLNADAEQIVAVLASLFGGSGAGGYGGTTGVDNRASRTGGLGSSGLGGATGSYGTGTAQARQAIERGAIRTSGIVAETETIRVTADPSTNSLIIIGSRRDYETIREVIKELDVRRKQVFVEAAILEVSLDKLRSFGTNLSIGFTVNDDTLGFGGTVLPGVPSLLGVAADPDASINVLGSLSGLFLGVVGEEVDPDGSGPIPPIPSFSALFQALTSLTDVNVLSTPSIITTDNEPAEIIVADVIPFPTGSTVGDSGVTVQTIQREPVGIRLSITPQISEGDFLNLNILTEVSAIRDTPVQGLNTAQFGIATTTRTADSSVVVKNGQTIVIGGLVQDRESVLQNRVPVLGNIPFLGNLFKFKQRQSQKINLMILLTPRIVENELDMQRILEERQRRNMLLQERGFNREDN